MQKRKVLNITQEGEDSKALKIQQEIDQVYDEYVKAADDDEERRKLRKKWKVLIKDYEILTGFNPYRITLWGV